VAYLAYFVGSDCCAYHNFRKSGFINLYNSSSISQENNGQDEINLNPPTEDELQAVEDNKIKISDEIDKEQNTSSEPTEGNKTTVKPIIGYIEVGDEQIRANGFISTMIEEGGTCTLTLRKGTQTAQTSTTSLADAQSTICGLIQINKTEVNNGEWTATTKL
jgi:hypothetical protein